MNQKLRVLIVEDSEDDAILIARILKKGGCNPDYLRVDTARAMTAALSSREWDVIISDYSMPNFDGLKALRIMQDMGMDLPFIVVSGVIGENVAVAAMRAGAHDYLLKDNLKRLVPAVQREVREAEERRRRREAEKALTTSMQELRKQEEALKEKSIALKEVLSQIESEKEEIKHQVSSSIEKLLLPTIRELKQRGTPIDKRRLELVEHNLQDLTSGFGKTLRTKLSCLSPRQIEMCGMIKSGMKNKEMAELMGISLRTVETHRNAIRKKLGISGDNVNLAAFLDSET
jgi:FixJ family two-component response regulator